MCWVMPVPVSMNMFFILYWSEKFKIKYRDNYIYKNLDLFIFFLIYVQ